MRSRILIAALAAIALLSSCKTQYDAILYGSDTAAKYKMAFELFEAKKYSKAAETFVSLTIIALPAPRSGAVSSPATVSSSAPVWT